MEGLRFATCINCIDGRTQRPVIAFMEKRLEVAHIDMVTEPGPDAILAFGEDETLIASIERRVRISVEKHASAFIAITGHHDCAGNPVPKEQHLEQIGKAVDVILGWGHDVPVLGIWLNELFEVEEIILKDPSRSANVKGRATLVPDGEV